MMYFSPSAADGRGAFFDDAIFGPREIDVIDQKRQEAALSKALIADNAEWERELAAADVGGELPIRRQFQRRQRQAEANPIMHRVRNPDCRLPADAVEISADEHATLMAAQADGQDIVAAVGTGRPIAVPRDVTAEQVLATVRKLRDRALAASDWTQLPDAAEALSAAKKLAWTEHRQKLRDLPGEVEASFSKHAPVGIVDPAQLLPVPPA